MLCNRGGQLDRARDIRLRAILQLLHQGARVVPYRGPEDPLAKRPGKQPCYDPVLQGRAEITDQTSAELWLTQGARAKPGQSHHELCRCGGHYGLCRWALLGAGPTINVAVLGLAQVDADDQHAQDLARDLGVKASDRAWMVRTRRGWKSLYRAPSDPNLKDRTKVHTADCVDSRKHQGCERVDLDLVLSPAIVPPSVHPSGFQYQWARGHSPDDIAFGDLQEPPDGVMDFWMRLCPVLPERPLAPPVDQSADVEQAIRHVLASLGHSSRLERPGKDGEITTRCPFPQNHQHGDRTPSFGINFGKGVWICRSGCGSGSIADLAEALGLPQPAVRRRRGAYETSSTVTREAVDA